jgi:hypothetical protein
MSRGKKVGAAIAGLFALALVAVPDGSAVLPALLLVAYFVPAIVAYLRHHHNENAIAVLNLLLGWTLLGWVAALVWALTGYPPLLAAS